MSHTTHAPLPAHTLNYAETHCRICAAGWTRKDDKGGIITICLLNREIVLRHMVDCDRYEQREDMPAADQPAQDDSAPEELPAVI